VTTRPRVRPHPTLAAERVTCASDARGVWGVGRHPRWKDRWNASTEEFTSPSTVGSPLEAPVGRTVGSDRKAQPPMSDPKTPRCTSVTPSRFERRSSPGRHDLLFKVVFGSDGAAARHYRTTRMTVWRWRHGKSPLPDMVSDDLVGLIQKRVEDAHEAQVEHSRFRALPPRPQRKLSGCCARYERTAKPR
jgi:hypothetical protein